ncbi:MAG: site-specific integrase, partial [Natronomonas sp.]
MHHPKRGLRTLRERIESGERGGSKADRDVLLEFSNQLELLSTEYSDHRHLKLLRHCTRMAENVGGLADALEDREAAEDIVRWINRTYDNEETNRDYRSAIRVFARRTLKESETPDSVAWIPTGTSSSYDPIPSERDLLNWHTDIQALLDAARNPRDRAMIAVQFEGGMRSGELQDLEIGDIFDAEYTTGLHVDGKTGERAVHLVISLPYLNKWLEEHPAPNDP